jgi:hypothetical protein
MSKKSARRGNGTSVEVVRISPNGFVLRVGRKTRLIRFELFPWFRDASIAQITNVTLPSPHHLHWPELDVDLAVESLDHPERYPLVSRSPATIAVTPKRSLARERRSPYKVKKRRP